MNYTVSFASRGATIYHLCISDYLLHLILPTMIEERYRFKTWCNLPDWPHHPQVSGDWLGSRLLCSISNSPPTQGIVFWSGCSSTALMFDLNSIFPRTSNGAEKMFYVINFALRRTNHRGSPALVSDK